MKGIVWKALFLFIVALCVSKIEVSASVYKVEDNWLIIKFPQWMEQPIVYFETSPRQKTILIFTNPFEEELLDDEDEDDEGY